MAVLRVKAADKNSILPKYDKAHGYLLYANEDAHLVPYERSKIKVGFSNAFPVNYCALVVQHGDLHVFSGLIDSDFRGDLGVLAVSDRERVVKRGEVIAKMLLLEIELPEICDVSENVVGVVQDG